MEIGEIITILISATITLMGWSFLYRENIFSRLDENLLVALVIGFTSYIGFNIIINNVIIPILSGDLLSIIPLIIGLLLLTKPFKKYEWISRLSLAVIAGLGTGVALRGVITAQISRQIIAAVTPFLKPASAVDWINNIVIIVGTISVLLFFFFTFKPTGTSGSIFWKISSLGRYFLIIIGGAILAGDYLSSCAFALERTGWLVTTSPAYYLIPIAFAIIIIDIFLRRKNQEKVPSNP